MALPIAPVIKVAKVVVPLVGPQATIVAKKLIVERQNKKQAHDTAWERGGKVGQVTFFDGVKRWVVVDGTGTPILAVPQYDNGSEDALAKGLAGVDFRRCMRAPDQELQTKKKAEKQRRDAEKSRRKDQAKAVKEATA